MYARTIGADTLSFGVSGMLWRENLVMYDRQSESWWSQADGVAIYGARRGTRLAQVPSDMMSWSEWRRLNPSTLVLSPPGGASGRDRYEAYHASRDIGVTGRMRSGGALDAKARVLGFQFEGRPYAVALDELRRRSYALVEAGDQRILVVATSDGLSARAFRTGGRAFASAGAMADGTTLRDDKGTEWDALTGRAITGPAPRPSLEPVTAHLSYWFSWHSFFPATTILRPSPAR